MAMGSVINAIAVAEEMMGGSLTADSKKSSDLHQWLFGDDIATLDVLSGL